MCNSSHSEAMLKGYVFNALFFSLYCFSIPEIFSTVFFLLNIRVLSHLSNIDLPPAGCAELQFNTL